MAFHYYLISELVYDIIKPLPVSQPILHNTTSVRVAMIHDIEFERAYHIHQHLPIQDQSQFWLLQIQPGQVDISTFNTTMLTIGNLFDEIDNQLSLSKWDSITAVIFAICDKLKISPIQLFNQSK